MSYKLGWSYSDFNTCRLGLWRLSRGEVELKEGWSNGVVARNGEREAGSTGLAAGFVRPRRCSTPATPALGQDSLMAA